LVLVGEKVGLRLDGHGMAAFVFGLLLHLQVQQGLFWFQFSTPAKARPNSTQKTQLLSLAK
jgi:hypothetical protein